MMPVVKSVVHFEIPASDVEKLSNFYKQVFGWKFNKMPMGGGMDYWMIETGPQKKSVGGGMYPKQGGESPRNYIMVDDIDASIATYTKAGGREVQPKTEIPGMGWSFLGTDPEGNAIGLFQATQTRPAARRAAARRGKSKSRSRR